MFIIDGNRTYRIELEERNFSEERPIWNDLDYLLKPGLHDDNPFGLYYSLKDGEWHADNISGFLKSVKDFFNSHKHEVQRISVNDDFYEYNDVEPPYAVCHGKLLCNIEYRYTDDKEYDGWHWYDFDKGLWQHEKRTID